MGRLLKWLAAAYIKDFLNISCLGLGRYLTQSIDQNIPEPCYVYRFCMPIYIDA